MSEIKSQQKTKHDLVIKSRESMSVDGVKEVVSFDEGQVILVTVCGEMTVEGEGLHINILDMDGGVVELNGKVEAVYYTDEKSVQEKGNGFFSRLFG